MGGGVALAVAGAFHAAAASLISKVDVSLLPRAKRSAGVLSDVKEVLGWLRGRRRALPLALLVGLANFGITGVMTVTQFQVVQRGGSALDVGFLTMAAGLSVLGGAALAGPLVSRLRTGTLIAIGFSWTSLGVTGLAFIHEGTGLVVLLATTFVGVPSLNAALTGFFFASTPTSMQGRVQAVVGTVAAGIGALAPLTVGVLLQRFGTTTAYLCSLGPMLAALALGLGARSLREIPRPDRCATLEP